MTSLPTLLLLLTATSSMQDTTWVFPEVVALPPEEVVIYIDSDETADAELSTRDQEILTSEVDTNNLDNEGTLYSGKVQEEQMANSWVEDLARPGHRDGGAGGRLAGSSLPPLHPLPEANEEA